jgi:hypothetical protein
MSPFWVNRNAYGLVRFNFHAQIKIKFEIFDNGLSEDSSLLAIIMLLWHTTSVPRLSVYVQAAKSFSSDVDIFRKPISVLKRIFLYWLHLLGKYRMFFLYYNFYSNLLMFNRVRLVWDFCYDFFILFSRWVWFSMLVVIPVCLCIV